MSAKPYALEIELDGLPKLQSGAWGHWRTRRKHDERWKDLIGWEVVRLGPPPKLLDFASVECIRFSTREPDWDNLVASFKPLIDGLIGTVLVDDSPTRLVRRYGWTKTDRGRGRMRIYVEERRP